MYQSHGMGYEEYGQKLDKRLKVEKRRELEYEKSLRVVDQASRRIGF